MKSTGRGKTVISSEAFCKLSYDKVGQVKQLLEGHEIYIIVYFRNYKEYFRSVYAQVVRDKEEIRSFSKFVSGRQDLVEYDRILRNWGEHFGYDHLIVRVYNEVVLKGNLLADFCKIIGFVTPDKDPDLQLQRNISPDERIVCALHLINLYKAKFPFFLYDHTYKNLKDSYYHLKKGYGWQKRIFNLLAGNRYFTLHAERLITDLAKSAHNELLKKMIGEESMKYLEL
jgi:hypothetical protein